MKSFLLAGGFLSTFFFGATSWAQQAPTRGSFGVGAMAGLRIEGPNESADGGLGLYLRGGVQLGDRFGIEDDVAFAGIPFPFPLLLVRDTLDFTITPVDWITFAVGPVGSWGSAESAWTLGGALRVDFHFLRRRSPGSARRAWTLGVAGDLGDVLVRDGALGGVAWGAYVTFGYAWY